MPSRDFVRALTSRVLNDLSQHRIRYIKTLCLMSCCIQLGLSMGIVGPTLIDLMIQTMSTLTTTALVMPFRAGGYAFGAFVCGLVYDYFNMQVLSIVTMSVSGVAMLIIPFLSNIWIILVLYLAIGMSFGMFEAGTDMFVLQVWGPRNPPFMQAIHLFFGLGAFIAPSIAKPFLLQTNMSIDQADDCYYEVPSVNESMTTTMAPMYSSDETKLVYPYGIVAIYSFINATFCLITYWFWPQTDAYPENSSAPENTATQLDTINDQQARSTSLNGSINSKGDSGISSRKTKDSDGKESSNVPSTRWPFGGPWQFVVVVTSAIFMHIYFGLEIAFGSFLTTFAVKSDLQLDTRVGASLTSLFWGVFTFFRLMAILEVSFFGIAWSIIVNLVVILIGNIFLVPFCNDYEWTLWVGTAIIGAGISPIWGLVFGYLRQYLTMSSRIAGTIITITLIGEFVFPAIIAKFIACDPMIFPWVVLFCSVAITCLFVVIVFLCKTKLKSNHGQSSNQATQPE